MIGKRIKKIIKFCQILKVNDSCDTWIIIKKIHDTSYDNALQNGQFTENIEMENGCFGKRFAEAAIYGCSWNKLF